MGKDNRSNYYFDLLPDPVVLEQLKSLLRYGVVYFWIQVLSATLLIATLWFSTPLDPWLMGAWYISIITLSVVRWSTNAQKLRETLTSASQLNQTAQRYLIISTMLSTLWGLSSILLRGSEDATLALHIILLTLIAISTLPLVVLSRKAIYVQVLVLFAPATLLLFTQSDIKLQLIAVGLVGLAGMMALGSHLLSATLNSLHHAQMRLMDQMNTDPLTQVANRRYFEQVFKLEWRRAARTAEPLSLLMIDVDHFKTFNDRFGHQAGDKCLQQIARNLQSAAKRAADVVARHGGEEFVILLPNTEMQDALNIAEALRHHIETLRLDDADQKPVTISIGVSSCVPSSLRSDTFDDKLLDREVIFPAMLLHAADRALYRAKHRGRNQVAHETCGAEDSEAIETEPVLVQAA